MLTSEPCAAGTQPPIQQWLALTGDVVLRAFDQQGTTTATANMIDDRLIPYLFKISKKTTRNKIHAIFIALCHQLYFAAQVARVRASRDPLPTLDKKWQVWVPRLLEVMRTIPESSTEYFGISVAEWRTWFDSIKAPLSQDIDAFVAQLKGSPTDLLSWLDAIQTGHEEAEGAFGVDASEGVEPGDQEFDILDKLEKLDPRGFVASKYVDLPNPKDPDRLLIEDRLRGELDTIRSKLSSSRISVRERKTIFSGISEFLLNEAVDAGTLTEDQIAPIINVLNEAHREGNHLTLLQATDQYLNTLAPRPSRTGLKLASKKEPPPLLLRLSRTALRRAARSAASKEVSPKGKKQRQVSTWTRKNQRSK
jgi:hypothetical protein